MSDNPIVVSNGYTASLSGTVKGPIVVTPQEGDSGDTTISKFGYNQPTYKVKLIANGKTFNMLLPPSIESKHPGRANPLQLPGLQIKAGINISKLKIPGFFPIYQNLGVETLTVSMSGMFTGYDGTNLVAAANWENSVGIGQANVEEGQDSFTSASELYDFAVNSKALVQVTIYTSDGSFIPKKSTSTTFRDTNSNISFKGYIKEFEQVYIRQDRNYYMLKFEIIDFNTNKCKTVVKSNKEKITETNTTPKNSLEYLTSSDKRYRPKEQIDAAEKIAQMLADKKPLKDITDEMDKINSSSLKIKLALYAESKGYDMTTFLTKESSRDLSNPKEPGPINNDSDAYIAQEFLDYADILCKRNYTPCADYEIFPEYKQARIKAINDYKNGVQNPATTSTSVPVTPSPKASPSNAQLTNDLLKLNDIYNYKQQKGLIKDLKDNNGVISDATMSTYARLDKSLSKNYTYKGNTTTKFPSDPQPRTYATFQSGSGDTLLLVPTTNDFSKFKLVPPP